MDTKRLFQREGDGGRLGPLASAHQHGGILRLDRLVPHGADVGNLTGQSLLMSRGV